ncbi:hypothetical protein OG474_30110 [Kribbella sp. NBC_01505]|uniref:hypothetical protein n=1 Tax=Kribbella sp. NBC_01505 TaxID=2903580 RepID=UPI0038646F2E
MKLTVDLVEIAERVRQHHHEVSGHEDQSISGYWTESYQRSEALFKAAIAAAYPNLNTEAVYYAWVDGFESVAHCAEWVRNNYIETSVEAPGEPLWSCCIERPEVIVEFEDASAIYSCRRCAAASPVKVHEIPSA